MYHRKSLFAGCQQMKRSRSPSSLPLQNRISKCLASSRMIGYSPCMEEDLFRKGEIIKFFSQSGYGFIRDEKGQQVYFHMDEVRVVGEPKKRNQIYEGMKIGFDVSRTSKGVRATHMKFYASAARPKTGTKTFLSEQASREGHGISLRGGDPIRFDQVRAADFVPTIE